MESDKGSQRQFLIFTCTQAHTHKLVYTHHKHTTHHIYYLSPYTRQKHIYNLSGSVFTGLSSSTQDPFSISPCSTENMQRSGHSGQNPQEVSSLYNSNRATLASLPKFLTLYTAPTSSLATFKNVWWTSQSAEKGWLCEAHPQIIHLQHNSYI